MQCLFIEFLCVSLCLDLSHTGVDKHSLQHANRALHAEDQEAGGSHAHPGKSRSPAPHAWKQLGRPSAGELCALMAGKVGGSGRSGSRFHKQFPPESHNTAIIDQAGARRAAMPPSTSGGP